MIKWNKQQNSLSFSSFISSTFSPPSLCPLIFSSTGFSLVFLHQLLLSLSVLHGVLLSSGFSSPSSYLHHFPPISSSHASVLIPSSLFSSSFFLVHAQLQSFSCLFSLPGLISLLLCVCVRQNKWKEKHHVVFTGLSVSCSSWQGWNHGGGFWSRCEESLNVQPAEKKQETDLTVNSDTFASQTWCNYK